MDKTVESATAAVAKLVLDEETGEMVSKNELKKRLQKRAKKARAKEEAAAAGPKEKNAANPVPAKAKPAKTEEAPAIEPDYMFKHGFLAEVFAERPITPVITRFPPEPNGYLHLGHAKAIAVDFGFAKYHGGKTILRYDDTNPDGEEQVYFDWILKMVRWLGFQPSEITHSSDYFDKLYDLAIKLVEMGGAYVCHCTEVEIKLQRGGKEGKEGPRFRCEHANQSVETNLAKFKDMRDGKYPPQAAFLRMKQDIENGNPQMWDLAAYRIPKNEKPHIRAPEWKVFPTYDFTHCLVDSFEGITHSLCTTEFIQARESYEWLNKSLGVYEPMQREFGRLNISGTIMSKRGLKKLVENKIVRGWDDPRLYTLIAIRRRGIPPGAILSFINELGVTTSRSIIPVARFEQSVRRYLEYTVPRLLLVLDPIPVTIRDLEEPRSVTLPFSPRDATLGSHEIPLTKTIYIDRSDFRETDSKGYFRLAPGKTVGLFQVATPIKAVSYSKDEETGLITGIEAEFCTDIKPKAFIQWVPEGSTKVEVRVHSNLFRSEDPTSVEGGFLNDINPDSETIFSKALIEDGFHEVRRRAPWPVTEGETAEDCGPEAVRFQALRIGYFAVDSDSTDERIVLNRIVSLKEDSGK